MGKVGQVTFKYSRHGKQTHRVLLEGDNGLRFLAVVPSPDGRYGALQAVTGENNVWMVENF